MSEDLIASFHRSLAFTETVLAGIDDTQRGDPTPCPEFTVEQLTAHVVGAINWFAELSGKAVAGSTTQPDATQPDVDLGNQRLDEAFRRAADRVSAAWTTEDFGRQFDLPMGSRTGAQMIISAIPEIITHGLDLALATGQTARPTDDLMELSFRAAAELGDALRGPHMMGPAFPVPENAPLVDRFLGFLGRDPAWTPNN